MSANHYLLPFEGTSEPNFFLARLNERRLSGASASSLNVVI